MTAGWKINILLVRYPGAMADFMCRLTGFPYTHATIGLGEDLNTFYSFVYKGFIVEKITRYLKPHRKSFPCALYEIEVSEYTYRHIAALLRSYAMRKSFLRYTRFSLALSLFRIPFKRKDYYFCSHFVAEVLQRSQAVRLQKNSVLCLPQDFHELRESRRVFTGDMQGMGDHYHLAEAATASQIQT